MMIFMVFFVLLLNKVERKRATIMMIYGISNIYQGSCGHNSVNKLVSKPLSLIIIIIIIINIIITPSRAVKSCSDLYMSA